MQDSRTTDRTFGMVRIRLVSAGDSCAGSSSGSVVRRRSAIGGSIRPRPCSGPVSAPVTPNVGIVTLREPGLEAAIDTAPVSIQDSAFEDAACALLVIGGNGRILRANRAAA